MRPFLRVVFFLSLMPLVSSAVTPRDLGSYAETVRTRVATKVQEVLAAGECTTVSGVVTYAGGECAFLQSGDGALKLIWPTALGPLPNPGESGCALGRPTLEGGRVVFKPERWTRKGREGLPAALPAEEDDLVFVSRTVAERVRDVHARRVEVVGRAIGTTENGFAIKVGELPVTVVAEELPDFLDNCGALHPMVRVTGVAELILDQSALLGRNRYVMGVRLFSCAAGIKLLPDAVYLLNRRDRRVRIAVIAAFVLLAAILVAVLVLVVRQIGNQVRTKAVMADRKRMAGDLHDTIEQHLVGAGMLLQLGRNAEARQILLDAKREMRDIIWGLNNDDMMRLKPAEMIREIAHAETRRGICRVEARLTGLPEHLEPPAMRDLSLILREAIGNAIKHGGAKKVAISSDPLEKDGWILRLSNDGLPFDPAKAPGVAEGHFGLEGMRTRARRIGAELSFERRGEKTIVVLRHM